jgi:hypothetical protein
MVAKKIYSILVASCLFITSLWAQIPDSSSCPNFMTTDINGSKHTLYNYLDSGYTVYIEITATWCPPCWQLHTSGLLKKFYNQYGPSGLNKVRVLFIESEPKNTIAQLQGITTDSTRRGLTFGNWITGTPYPIIEDTTIAPLLGVEGYPTICAISPNRQLFTMVEQTVEQLTLQLNKFVAATGKNNMFIMQYTGLQEIFCSQNPFIPQIKVQNLGLDTVKSCEISLKIGNNLIQTKKITGLILRKYDTLIAYFAPIHLNDSAYLTFNISSVNNVPDTFNNRNTAAYLINVSGKTDLDMVTVEVRTDKSPEQTYWKIVDQSGVKIAEGGNSLVRPYDRQVLLLSPDAYTSPFKIYKHKVGLRPNTCYDIYLWDYFGDGLGQPYIVRGNVVGQVGYFKIIANDKEIYDLGYYYPFSEIIRPLERGSLVGTKAIDNLNSLSLYPSPVNEILTLDFSLSSAKELTISVVNILGQTLKTLPKQLYTEGGNSVQINVENFENGVYFIHLKENRTSIVRKFIIQH